MYFFQFLHLPVDVTVLHLITHGSASHCISHTLISALTESDFCPSKQMENINTIRHKLMSDTDGYCNSHGLFILWKPSCIILHLTIKWFINAHLALASQWCSIFIKLDIDQCCFRLDEDYFCRPLLHWTQALCSNTRTNTPILTERVPRTNTAHNNTVEDL